MLDCDAQFLDLHLVLRYFFLAVADARDGLLQLPFQLLLLLLNRLHLLVLKGFAETSSLSQVFCLLALKFFELDFNVIELFLEVSFLEVQRNVEQFVLDLVSATNPAFQFFLLVPKVVGGLLVVLIPGLLCLKASPFLLYCLVQTDQLAIVRQDH